MAENNQPQGLIQLVQDLATQVKALSQRVSSQEKELNTLKAKLANYELQPACSETPNITSQNQGVEYSQQPTTRRTLLKRLAFGLVLGAVASTTGVVAGQPGEVQARVIINPSTVSNKVGALIFPSTTNYANQPLQSSAKFGLITSADPGTLDLTTLPLIDTGIYTQCQGYGVYAICSNSQGNGVFATNTATTGTGNAFGVYAVSVMGTGVAGASNNNGYGVFGQSNTGAAVYGFSQGGSGVKAESGSGAPLTIKSGNTPTSGTRAFGDLYVDSNGVIYAWAKTAAGNTSTWRPLAFSA